MKTTAKKDKNTLKQIKAFGVEYYNKDQAYIRLYTGEKADSYSYSLPLSFMVESDEKSKKQLTLNKLPKKSALYSATSYTKGNFQLESNPLVAKQLLEMFKNDKTVDNIIAVENNSEAGSSETSYFRDTDFSKLKAYFKDSSAKLKKNDAIAIEANWNGDIPLMSETYSLANSFLVTGSILSVVRNFAFAISSHILQTAASEYSGLTDFELLFNQEFKIKNAKENIALHILDNYVANKIGRQSKFKFGDSELAESIFEADKEQKLFAPYIDVMNRAMEGSRTSFKEAIEPFYSEELVSLSKRNGFVETFYDNLAKINLGFAVNNPSSDYRATQKEILKYLQFEGREGKDKFHILDNVKSEDAMQSVDSIYEHNINDANDVFTVLNAKTTKDNGLIGMYDLHQTDSRHVLQMVGSITSKNNCFMLLNETQAELLAGRHDSDTFIVAGDGRHFGVEDKNDLYLMYFPDRYHTNFDAFTVHGGKNPLKTHSGVITLPKWDDSISKTKNKTNAKQSIFNNISNSKSSHDKQAIAEVYTNAVVFDSDKLKKNISISLEENNNKDFLKKNFKEFCVQNLFHQLSTLNISGSAKKIPNNFYYEESAPASIEDIKKNLPLATHIARMPIGETVYNVAKNLKIELPEPSRTFHLGNPKLNIAHLPEKDKVTSKNIGAMGFSYLPKSFTLKATEDKEKLLEIIKEIVEENKTSKDVSFLKLFTKDMESEILKADYLFLKNEQTMNEASRFVSKEILVLGDSYAKDMGKLNISSSSFYQKLKEKKIFNIDDYIEVENLSTKGLKKLSESLCQYISEFKEDHFKETSADKSKIDSILIGKVLPILFKQEHTPDEQSLLVAIGKHFKLDDFYDQFLTVNTTDLLLSKVSSSLEYGSKQKEQLLYFLNKNFARKEFKAINENSQKFFKILSQIVPDDKQFKTLENEIFTVVRDKKLIENALTKTIKSYTTALIVENRLESLKKLEKEYSLDKSDDKLHQIKKTYAELKKINDNMYLNIMGLRPFQYTEALGFAALKQKNSKDTMMLFAEMRVGKTRTELTSLLLQSFLTDASSARSQFYVQNKNIDDIAEQAFDMFPLMARDMLCYGTSEKAFIFSKDKSLEMPLNLVNFVSPQIVAVLRDVLSYRFAKDSLKSDSEILIDTYSSDMEQLFHMSKKSSVTEIENKYSESPFVEVLRLNKKYGKADEKLKESLKTTFLYIERIYKQGYLSEKDAPAVASKIDKFVSKYYRSKLLQSNANKSRFGVDLLPKNILYSYDINSTLSNVDFEKIDVRKKVSLKTAVKTPYLINVKEENSFTIAKHEMRDLSMIEKIRVLIEEYYSVDSKIEQHGDNATVIVNAISTSQDNKNEFVGKMLDEKFEKRFSTYGLNEDIVKALIVSHVSPLFLKAMEKTAESPYYRIKGSEDISTMWKIDIGEIFNRDELYKKAKALGFGTSDDKYEKTLDVMSEMAELKDIAQGINKENYFDAIFNYFYTPLNKTNKQKVKSISPLLYSKASAFTSEFSIDMQAKDNTIMFPVTLEEKDYEGNKTSIHRVEIFSLNTSRIDRDFIENYKSKKITKAKLNFSQDGSHSLMSIPIQDDMDALYSGKRMQNLASTVVYGINANSSRNIGIDEIHKGLKRSSFGGAGKLFDVISMLHKNTIGNGGSFASLSGTPISGKASDIGPIMTTGASAEVGDNISKNIQRYCTSYAFKDELDALMIGFLNERLTSSEIHRVFMKIMSDSTFTPDKISLDSMRDEVHVFARKTINNIDKEDLEQMIKNIHSTSIESRINNFRDVFGGVDAKKIKKNSKYKVDVLKVVYAKIKEFTTQVPGISNFTTLSEIIRKLGNNNAISISRPTDEVKYNVLDREKILKMIHERDNSTNLTLDYKNMQHKILMLDVALRKYSHHTHVIKVKSNLGKVFNAFSIQFFDKNNMVNTMNNIDYTPGGEGIAFLNSLIASTSKTTNDSIADLFTRKLNGEDLTEKVDAEKIKLFESIMPLFVKYLDDYSGIYNDAKDSFEASLNTMPKSEPRPIKYGPFVLGAIRMINEVSPIVAGNIVIGGKTEGDLKVTFDSNFEPVLTNQKNEELPLVFKTNIKVNRWEFLNGHLEVPFNLVNTDDKEMLEVVATSGSVELFKNHLDGNENIRVMSGRSSILQASFLDTIAAGIKREDQDKSLVIIVNQSSGAAGNIQNLINLIDEKTLTKNNIDIKISNSSASFTNILNEVNKNKNVQIAAVGNYIALAEGIDMSMIDTGFYLGSLRASAETIQSFARQRGHNKEESSFYLIQDGAVERLRHPTHELRFGNKVFSDFAQAIKSGFQLDEFNTPEAIVAYDDTVAKSVVSSVVGANFDTLEKLKAYEAIMSGVLPEEKMTFEEKGLYEHSSEYKNDQLRIKEEELLAEKLMASKAEKEKSKTEAKEEPVAPAV